MPPERARPLSESAGALTLEDCASLDRLRTYAEGCWRESHRSGYPAPAWLTRAAAVIRHLAARGEIRA